MPSRSKRNAKAPTVSRATDAGSYCMVIGAAPSGLARSSRREGSVLQWRVVHERANLFNKPLYRFPRGSAVLDIARKRVAASRLHLYPKQVLNISEAETSLGTVNNLPKRRLL